MHGHSFIPSSNLCEQSMIHAELPRQPDRHFSWFQIIYHVTLFQPIEKYGSKVETILSILVFKFSFAFNIIFVFVWNETGKIFRGCRGGSRCCCSCCCRCSCCGSGCSGRGSGSCCSGGSCSRCWNETAIVRSAWATLRTTFHAWTVFQVLFIIG